MNLAGSARRRLSISALLATGIAAGVVALVVIAGSVDVGALTSTASNAGADPGGIALALAAFAAAFALRAAAWRRVLPGLSFAHSLAAIHAALGANHVLPFRLGEPVRVLSVVRRQGIGFEAATASTITLRSADMLSVVALGVMVAPRSFFDLVGPVGWFCVAAIAIVAVATWRWLANLAGKRRDIVMPGAAALAMSASAWLLEAVLVWQTARWAGIDADWSTAILVTTVAVASQIAAIAPGGFGTYEAAATAAWVVAGYDPGDALVAALAAHALKTAYSIVAGGTAVMLPAPSLLGRFRLASSASARAPHSPADPGAPIVLFMPAYNEEATVEACIRRAPSQIDGHPVHVLVIDDGSTDSTAEVARRAGALVHSLGTNRGLGAAVRAGFDAAADLGAGAVAFCDADGEYPPEELAALVRPVLAGHADYVGGSRFLGRIDHMLPHRRIGNIVLTRLLSIMARRRITDGQTGYRAFSPQAAEAAEIIHDFNYAQVLTLDLLAKGFRYTEVPISYRFRTTGESFVKLGPYLRRVVPAVYRELNTA